jgi:hypothetical protein
MNRRIIKGDTCLNCGQELHGENYCPNCGQLNNTAKPTFGQLIMDALANLFAFDSKFYLSIWPLMRYPGRLSLELVNGKKATYLPPIRLFLLVVIITLGLNSLSNRAERGWGSLPETSADKNIDNFLDIALQDSLNTDTSDISVDLSFDESNSGSKLQRMFKFATTYPDLPAEEALIKLDYELTFWNEFWYSYSRKLTLMSFREFIQYIKSNLIFILLLFVPIMAAVLKLLYFYKKQYFFVDHFVFSIHAQTAFFVFIAISVLLNMISGTTSWLLLLLFFPVYLIIALKNFYKQRWLYTLINYSIISTSFVFVASIFLFLVGLVSFLLI